MKISVDRGILLKALNHVQSVVERRNTIPILSNVKIAANKKNISLIATDLDLEIIEFIDANVSVSGSTTVSAHTLYDIVRKIPEESLIEIELNSNDQMKIKSGQSLNFLSKPLIYLAYLMKIFLRCHLEKWRVVLVLSQVT